MENCGFVIIKNDGSVVSGDMMVDYSLLISLKRDEYDEVLIFKDVNKKHLDIIVDDKSTKLKDELKKHK